MTTLVAERAGGEAFRSPRAGVGRRPRAHAFALGLPIVLFAAFLPARVQQAAETAVGVMIVVLAALLLLRWWRGEFAPGGGTRTTSAPPCRRSSSGSCTGSAAAPGSGCS